MQDVLTVIAFLRAQGVQRINLVGAGDAGVWALLAAGVSEGALHRVAAYRMDASSQDPAQALRSVVPGLLKVGGLATAIALAAPTPVLVLGADSAFAGPRIGAVYAAAGAPSGFQHLMAGDADQVAAWLTRP